MKNKEIANKFYNKWLLEDNIKPEDFEGEEDDIINNNYEEWLSNDLEGYEIDGVEIYIVNKDMKDKLENNIKNLISYKYKNKYVVIFS